MGGMALSALRAYGSTTKPKDGTKQEKQKNLLWRVDELIPIEKETPVSPSLKRKIQKFDSIQKSKKISLNNTLKKKHNFHNPAILKTLVKNSGIKEFSSNFSSEQFPFVRILKLSRDSLRKEQTAAVQKA